MARTNSLAITLAALMAVAVPAMGQQLIVGGANARRAISATTVLSPAGGQTPAEEEAVTIDVGEQLEGIHLEADGSEFQLTDGQGYLWDITANGTVHDGSGDAYDGGITLAVSGETFPGGTMVTGADSREIEIGPWQTKTLNVWRRVYVDPDTGYCRWIDIFQNRTDKLVKVRVSHMSTLGASPKQIYRPMTDQGSAEVPVTWGLATKDAPYASRPAIAHIWGAPNSTNIPIAVVSLDNAPVFFTMGLELTPGQTVAVCVFQAQRYQMADASLFLDDFDHAAELAKIPQPLLDIIVNMQADILIAGPVVLQRSSKEDVLVLHDETDITGKLLNEQFVIETFYGPITLSADDVMGLGRADTSDQQVHVALTNGQIVAGRLTSGPMKLQRPDETVMIVPVERLISVAFTISDTKPASVRLDAAHVRLQSGQRLIFQTGPQELTFFTEYGQLTVPTDMLEYLDLAASGELHMARFTNGSRLSGVLADEQLDFALQLGPDLSVDKAVVAGVRFSPASRDQPEGTAVTLKNEDVIYGKLVAESLEVQTPYGLVTVAAAEVRKITILPQGRLGQVRIELHEQSAVSGELVSDALSFEIADGLIVEVFVGLIAEVTMPEPIVEAPPQPDEPTSEGEQPTTDADPEAPIPGAEPSVPPHPPEPLSDEEE